MSSPEQLVEAPPLGADSRYPRRVVPFAITGLVLIAVFSPALFQTFRFAASDGLHSYIVLVPFISGYLAWLRRGELPAASPPAWAGTVVFAALSLLALGAYFTPAFKILAAPHPSAWLVLAFLGLIWAASFWLLGRALVRALAFPLFFLVFILPLPAAVIDGTETLLQRGSANVAAALFELAGTPSFRDGLVFRLPNIVIQVAPECSGIRSTLVLFLTSLIAAHLLLDATWKRVLLTLAILPLALLRNGFRIFVISVLCIRIGPHMIDSAIHRHGGPLFFALSLLPLGGLLLFLVRPASQKT